MLVSKKSRKILNSIFVVVSVFLILGLLASYVPIFFV